MYSSISIFKRRAVKAKNVMLLGTAVVGTLLMSFTTVENSDEARSTEKAGSAKMETVQVKAEGHNLQDVVKALGIIDPAWVKKLRKAKESKKAVKKAVTVTYGVVRKDGNRLYLTDEEVDVDGGICGAALDYPCKVIFDTSVVTIHEDENTGELYIDYEETAPPYTEVGQGPYTPAP